MRKTLLLILSLALVTGCWKKQDHNIVAPEIPSYALNGIVLDMSTLQPLSDIVVQISAASLVYDVQFDGAADTTLADGSYHFDKITPGQYIITCTRNSYEVISQNLVMEHQDKVYDMNLPLPLLSRVNYGPPAWPSFSALCVKEAGVIAGFGTYRMIWYGDYVNDFKMYGQISYTNKNPQMGAMTLMGRFWCSGSGDNSNIVYSIDPAHGNVEGQTSTSFKIRDLSAASGHIFATNDVGKIVKFGNHPSIVEEILNIPVIQPYGLACENEKFWVADYETGYIFRLNASQEIMEVYRPFAYWQGQGVVTVKGILHLAYDPLGYLFADDGNYVYKFSVES